jgi:hypothetical protein
VPEQRVLVQCSICGIRYDVSARSWRDIKAGRVEARCVLHRRRSRQLTVTATMRRYWLDRFTIDEICEMAEAIWPRPSQRAPMRDGYMTASSSGPTGPP